MKKWIKKNKDLLITILIGLVLFLLGLIIFNIVAGIILFVIVALGYVADKYGFTRKIKKRVSGYSKKSISSKKSQKSITIKDTKEDSMKKKDLNTKRKRKKVARRVVMVFIILSFIFFIIGLALMCGFCYYIVTNAPDFNPDVLYSSEPTIIYDKYGNEIDRIGIEKRKIISYEELPEVLVNAIIATEDSQFFQHNGVDIKRFLMASAQQLRGIDAGGASTLTMQLSKKNYTSDTATGVEGIIRKFTDVYIAVFKIENVYTKQQILEFYINSNYLGGGYGVEQTSLTYFGKSAKDLNLAEAAMIAGLFQAPGKYNPYTNPEGTEQRRQNVLKLMLRHGYINKTEYEIAKEMTVEKIVKTNVEDEDVSEFQSFIDQVTYEVSQKTGKDPAQESMKIYTTMDPEKQRHINSIMNNNDYWENADVKAGVAVVDVHTGEVVALGGGRNITSRKSLNYATRIRRQIGSTAKPLFDYAPAIEYNGWGSSQPLPDEPITYSNGTSISNWDGNYFGYETMREALMYSRNIPALKTFKLNDKSKVASFVTTLGLHPEIENGSLHEAHSIGGYGGESALTMAAAYAAFANKGYYTSPYTFYKVEFADGTEYNNVQAKVKAMSEETAYIITNMLVDTGQYALTAYYHNINNQQFAAKTGTTNYDYNKLVEYGLQWSGAINDLWVVGYNTDYAIGVWYGYDEFDGIHYSTVGTFNHARLFHDVAVGFFNNNETFEQPSGVVAVETEYGCPVSTLASEYTPADLRRTEYFAKGTEPTNVSERFDKLKDVTNLKATSSGSTVTLTWTAIATPMAKDQAALKEYYKTAFQTESGLNDYVGYIMNDNNNRLGNLGYNVYLKDKSGNLSLLTFTTNTKVELKNQSGDSTYVVKAAYSNFPSNQSDGKSVSIKLNEYIDPNKSKFIKQLYSNCLNKTASTDDIRNWISYSASYTAYGICGSQEAKNLHSTIESDLKAIYNGILGRNYKTDEFNSIKDTYNSSRDTAVKKIINSTEFKNYCSTNGLTYSEI